MHRVLVTALFLLGACDSGGGVSVLDAGGGLDGGVELDAILLSDSDGGDVAQPADLVLREDRGDIPVPPLDVPLDIVGAEDTASPLDSVGGEDVAPFAGPTLAGTWAERRFHASFTEIPVLGEQPTSTTSYSLVVAAQQGDELALAGTTCGLEIDNGTNLVNVIAPDALIASLPQGAALRGSLVAEGEGWRYLQERYTDVRGARLEDPLADALPTDAEDPRVYDQDGDGNPGITMVVQGLTSGLLYIVQRASYALGGEVESADRVVGLSDWTDEQVILGTDNPSLASERPKRPGAPEDSVFEMVRIPEGSTCADVMAGRATLFSE